MTPEQVRAHMVEYLYGELPEERRREFEAALATSESHRRELAALERTLGLARAALARELSEEPPAAVRGRVLEAAREASRVTSAPAAAPARPAPATERRGLWALLRAPWLYPAVGFAAALAIVIVIDRRDRASDPEPLPHEEAPVSTATSDERLSESRAEEQGRPAPAEPALGAHAESSKRASLEREQRAGPARDRSGRGGASPEEPAAAATGRAAKPATQRRAREYAVPPPSAPTAERSFESAPNADPFPGRAQDDEAEGSAKGGAWAASARDTSATPSAPRVGSHDRAPRGTGAPQPSSAPRATGAPPPSGAPRAEATAAESTRDFAAAPAEAAMAEREPLARRAAEQQRDGLFAQAVKSYRELLRRYPSDPRVAEWRRALALAQQALRADAGDAR